jgi:hypothetical protein
MSDERRACRLPLDLTPYRDEYGFAQLRRTIATQ